MVLSKQAGLLADNMPYINPVLDFTLYTFKVALLDNESQVDGFLFFGMKV